MAKQVYNASKLAFHPEKLEAIAKGEHTAPITVRFKPTNRCNHRCHYCSYSPDNHYVLSETINLRDEIPRGKLLETLDCFGEMGVKATTYSGGGEPLLHPNIEEALERNLRNGIQFSMITNGQLIQDRKAELLAQAEWIRVSANSCDAVTFNRIRNINPQFFYKLEENLKAFARLREQVQKPETEFGADFVITQENQDQVYGITKYLKGLGLTNVKFSPVWFGKGFQEYHEPFRQDVTEQIERAQQELADDGFTVADKYTGHFDLQGVCERKYERCFMSEANTVVAADCNVYICHDKAYSIGGLVGSIKDQSFKDLWFDPQTAAFLRDFNAKERCGHHCSWDNRNLAIAEMIADLDNLEKYVPKNTKHKNFV